MIDHFTIFTKGGRVLWSKTYSVLRDTPVNSLIQKILIEDRTATSQYDYEHYVLQWTLANDLSLIFVVVYQKMLQLLYIDNLLSAIKKEFIHMFEEEIKNPSQWYDFSSFDVIFEKITNSCENEAKNAQKNKIQRKFDETTKYKVLMENTLMKTDKKPQEKEVYGSGKNESSTRELSPDLIARNIETLKARTMKKMPGSNLPIKKTSSVSESDTNVTDNKKKTKKPRKWDGSISKEEEEALNYSEKTLDMEENNIYQFVNRDDLKKSTTDGVYEISDIEYKNDSELEDRNDFDEVISKKSSPKKTTDEGTKFMSFFKGLSGQKVLEEKDITTALEKTKEHLITKNVAKDIAERLCESVSQNLIGQKVGSFKSISSIFKESLEVALKRILTPKQSVDLLRDIYSAQQQKVPYSIVFCGVNGVGKSTNLAKICFWLLQNELKVLIAACDTFRSGAVEQLRVHTRNLCALDKDRINIELYEKGYGKDAASIAKDAINYAKNNGFDVVLIDTAGRMQDNEPLMRSLVKLINVNNPNKIVFVGEALVGNEAVDQLVKFNQAIKDFSNTQNPRQIDGIVLTKFDTIDDKVGAAISMAYVTGQPILFVGTGQSYTDLKKINVRTVVQVLLMD